MLMRGSGTELFILLFAGHLIADFVVQTRRVADGKREARVLLRHGLEVLLVQAFLALPYLSPALLGGIVSLTLIHVLSDAWKARCPDSWSVFLRDQAIHLAAIALLALLVGRDLDAPRMIDPLLAARLTWGALLLGLLGFNIRGGSVLVRFALGPRDADPDAHPRGAMVGYLERILVFTLLVGGEWSAVGLVFAAKSIARFRELENKEFSDYYLIGTLASVLVAVATAGIASWARAALGVALPW
jgi:hypothetical protein